MNEIIFPKVQHKILGSRQSKSKISLDIPKDSDNIVLTVETTDSDLKEIDRYLEELSDEIKFNK